MSDLIRWLLYAMGYGIFAMLDHLFWLLIQLLPGPSLVDLARRRPWLSLRLRFTSLQQQRWAARVVWLLRVRDHRARWGSSCLSRSLAGRLLLDLIGVANELHFGMNRFSDGRKVPHAWLRDPLTGRLLTPGLSPGAGTPLIQF